MSKFKIEKGVSRINRVKLQVSIEESIAADLASLCEWSNNDKNYVVNELLRFALAQDNDFQRYKASAGNTRPTGKPEPVTPAQKPATSIFKSEPLAKEPASGVYR